MGTILIAEDDQDIRQGLEDLLASEGYQVQAAADGTQALELGRQHHFECAILDIMMPGKSGFEVCRALRALRPELAILMLTAKGEEIDKVAGLRAGADDYLTKPFGMYELLARVEALLRRVRLHKSNQKMNAEPCSQFSFGWVSVDTAQMRIRNESQTFPMTARELALLKLFHQAPKQVLTRDFLLEQVWGQQYHGTTRTVDQHIAQLRKKLEINPNKAQLIKTVHGLGYRFEPEN